MGIYKLVKLFFEKTHFYTYLLPIVFYILSPALLNGWLYSYVYAFAPWFIYFIFKAIKLKRLTTGDVVFMSFLFSILSTDLPNPKYIFYLVVASLIIMVMALFLKLIKIRFFIENLGRFILFFLLTAYILIPLSYFAFTYSSPASYGVTIKSGAVNYGQMSDYGTATMDKMVRLHQDGMNMDSRYSVEYNSNPIINFLSYLPIIWVVVGLLVIRNGYYLIFTFLAIIFLIFSVGPNKPFGALYEFLISNFKLLAFLRTTAGAVFFLSTFYAIPLAFVLERFKNINKVFVLVIFLCLLAIGYPFLNGDYYRNRRTMNQYTDNSQFGLKIPEDYFQVKKQIDSLKKDSRILLSIPNMGYINTNWGFFGFTIYSFLYDSYNMGYSNITSNFANHSVGTVYNDKSLIEGFKSEGALNKEKLIPSYKYGFIELSRVINDNFLPHFYTPKNIIISAETSGSLSEITSQPDYQIRSAIYNVNVSQFGFKKVISVVTKTDKSNKLTLESKKVDTLINNFEVIGWNKLSPKDKTELDKTRQEKKIVEQKKTELQLDPGQYFAMVEEGGLYNFSFQLLSCHEENFPFLSKVPVITIGSKDYDIPYQTLSRGDKIITDQNCFVTIKDANLEKGEVKIMANYIFDLDNLIFSKAYPGKEIDPPVIEFKKVDPTKYIVKIHNVRSSFPLVFSESFHAGWKAYPVNIQTNSNLDVSNYKILTGNEADQASSEELTDYINKGWVTDVGKNDFVSKNFQGTIQNDNLPTGQIWETWFKTPMPEETHQLVNGYANSWLIDPAKTCAKTPCDFELIIEFWPQRLSYLGFIISGLTLTVSLIIILVSRIKKNELE
ncbi:MAG: hypothetical protein Q7S14_01345 [bacterium]|nr:hypothetical protein [bacterium]